MTSGETLNQITLKCFSVQNRALLQFRTSNAIAYHIHHGFTSCKNMAREARNITKSHGNDFNVANHEAVVALLSEQHRTESIWVNNMCTILDVIIPSAIIEKLHGSWRYLHSHSTMLVFPCLCSWPWYVNGTLWKKEHGLVWRTCLVWILFIWSLLICSVTMDGLVCVNKNWAHSESNVRK